MKVEIPQNHQALNRFLSEERSKVFAYLHKAFNLEDADLDDIYQEASLALYLNIRDGKLTTLTSTLSTYFLRVCVNQTLKFLSKKKRTVSLSDQIPVSTKQEFMADKIDELYHLSTEDASLEELSYSERIVQAVIKALPETCRNIFMGYYWNNFDNNTIADVYGFANANSVKTQKYKCVSKFKQKYQELIRRHYE
jgi:RNA polymerase sigma factor (sigma-70 family)